MSLSQSAYKYKFNSDLDSDSDFESDKELMTEIIAIVVPLVCMHLHRKDPYYDQKVMSASSTTKDPPNSIGPTGCTTVHL